MRYTLIFEKTAKIEDLEKNSTKNGSDVQLGY